MKMVPNVAIRAGNFQSFMGAESVLTNVQAVAGTSNKDTYVRTIS